MSEKDKNKKSYSSKKRILQEINKENFLFALTLIDREISSGNEDPELYYNFAICCARTDNYKKCVSILENLLEKFPRFGERENSILMIVYSLIQNKEYSKALVKCEERLKIQVDDLKILSMKAFALEKSGRIEEAIDIHKRILRLRPDHKNSLNSLGYLLLNQRVPSPDEWKLAADCLKSVLKDDPENPAYLDSFGVLLYKSGKKEEAILAFRKALSKVPTHPEILEHIEKVIDST
ncbi:tetratricopeptide repeat protein [Leptospira weilii serovar Ranarum str. ICFT]|uniref:Tetratricopeptide repeat protein n=1 Tax=Leptospira weilii serovar Ranarum str. ICFT TaxID=1218598 RepID=N1WH33_9LEPT|nr:tetratricopeptide repeat protein [Leptospira weilii]EMY79566.1 tetratricopeptide repeat protein [Leptospira weilii serovar Ranarum str. ICFT]